MNVLVVGSGAREHAIVWKLGESPRVDKLLIAPGNAGTGSIATNFPDSSDDVDGLLQLAKTHSIDLTIVGPEMPLANGIVDLFVKEGHAIFGPTKAAARIESSKAFAKELMRSHGVPVQNSESFTITVRLMVFCQNMKGLSW